MMIYLSIRRNLVIQRPKNVPYGFLFGEGWVRNWQGFKERYAKVAHCRTGSFVDFDFVLNLIGLDRI